MKSAGFKNRGEKLFIVFNPSVAAIAIAAFNHENGVEAAART